MNSIFRLKANSGNAKENAFSCLASFSLIELNALTDALRHNNY